MLLLALVPLVVLTWPVVRAAMAQSEQDQKNPEESEENEAKHAAAHGYPIACRNSFAA